MLVRMSKDSPDKPWDRRQILTQVPLAGLGLAVGCQDQNAAPSSTLIASPASQGASQGASTEMSNAAGTNTVVKDTVVKDTVLKNPVLNVFPLGFPWKTFDPFLFCAYHKDHYPVGNAEMGPAASLAGRHMGSDFAGIDGWRMYHGEIVPGFPQHPHRGFETVTVTRSGFVDHSDSMGATARYGNGDVQWMTAGRGIVHAEMFPLLNAGAQNPTELFQIWLNLPSTDKFVPPHFSMMWAEQINTERFADAAGRVTSVRVIAGTLNGKSGPTPPPASWAAKRHANVAIWSIDMAPNGQWVLPAAPSGVTRTLYFHRGSSLTVAGRKLTAGVGISLEPETPVPLEGGADGAEILLLQGMPIGEPVVQHGPFVMNTPEEINQAFRDYRATGFGGWPWRRADPVHPRTEGRFALHADGHKERAG